MNKGVYMYVTVECYLFLKPFAEVHHINTLLSHIIVTSEDQAVGKTVIHSNPNSNF